MMFLFADLAIPQAVPNWADEVLDDEITSSQASYSVSASKDTAIDFSNPTMNYGLDQTVSLGLSLSGETRILISFNNTSANGSIITDAILE